jgi:hypothetical protein
MKWKEARKERKSNKIGEKSDEAFVEEREREREHF